MRANTVSVGSPAAGTIAAAARATGSRSGESDMPGFGPIAAMSRFTYATALVRISASCASTHSVLPMMPNSSAPHAANTMLRAGMMPRSARSATQRAASSRHIVPAPGSAEP